MGSLGTVLSLISLNAAPIFAAAGVGIAALDLSHIATFIAAVFGGPLIGGLVGFLGGIYAGYYFGFTGGSSLGLLSLIGVPLGKAFTGIIAGLLYKRFGVGANSHRSIFAFPLTLLSYVPESIYTILYFAWIVPLVFQFSLATLIPIVIPKGWLEITIMGVMMSLLTARTSFRDFVSSSSIFRRQKNSIVRNKK
jgi:LytS/YehU family sensor histidine kinase